MAGPMYLCDRCGDTHPKEDMLKVEDFGDKGTCKNPKDRDLCPKCSVVLGTYLKCFWAYVTDIPRHEHDEAHTPEAQP